MNKPVALHIIDLSGQHGCAYFFQLRRIHLGVAGHHGCTIDRMVTAPFVAGGDGCAYTTVLQMVNEDDTVGFRGIVGNFGGNIKSGVILLFFP